MTLSSSQQLAFAWILFLAALAWFQACGKPDQPTTLNDAQPTVSQPTPSPTPAPTPVPTPGLSGPDFPGIRANKEIIHEPDKLAKYGHNLSGKAIGGWVGRIVQILPIPASDQARLVVEMDLEQKDPRYFLPDVVLQNIPAGVAAQLRTDEVINFSGVLGGFMDFDNYKFILAVNEARIFGFPSSASPEIQSASAAAGGS
ncbi:MAG: hypothetical protein ACE15F_06810 [bacterium]